MVRLSQKHGKWCFGGVNKECGKRSEAVLLAWLVWQLWIADFFISPASWGLSSSWYVQGLEFAEALTEWLLYCETSYLPQKPSGKSSQTHMRHLTFPSQWESAKTKSSHSTFSLSNRQCFKWHIVQKVVFAERFFALWSGNKYRLTAVTAAEVAVGSAKTRLFKRQVFTQNDS